MPYSRNSGLPSGVRTNLPAAAQTIYRNAFNAVYEKTGSDERAARAGWAAVKRAGYHKKGDKWVRGFEPPESGDLPAEGKKILADAYGSCRSKWVKAHPSDKENQDNKTDCSKRAWGAVHKAGYRKVNGRWARAAQGFITTLGKLGDNTWEVQWSAKDVVYKHPDFGTVRLCPKKLTEFAPTAEGRPITLNHSEKVIGRVLESRVDGDRPIIKFQVDEETNKMMETEGWAGGVSPSLYPTKLTVDPEGIADYIATGWEFEALGVGDGSQTPACPQGVCSPKKVTGMADEPMDAAALADAKAKAEAARAQKAAETEAAKKAQEAAEAESLLKDLKATSTEDTMKVFEKLMDSKLKPLTEENAALKDQLKAITSSKDELEKYKTKKLQEEKEALIKTLPADAGVDYDSRSVEQLREMVDFVNKIKKDTAPPPAGEPTDVPEPQPPQGAGRADVGGRTDDEIRAFNAKVKAKYKATPKK